MHSGNYIGINKLVDTYAFQLLREVDDTGLAQVAVYHPDQYATLRSVRETYSVASPMRECRKSMGGLNVVLSYDIAMVLTCTTECTGYERMSTTVGGVDEH